MGVIFVLCSLDINHFLSRVNYITAGPWGRWLKAAFYNIDSLKILKVVVGPTCYCYDLKNIIILHHYFKLKMWYKYLQAGRLASRLARCPM